MSILRRSIKGGQICGSVVMTVNKLMCISYLCTFDLLMLINLTHGQGLRRVFAIISMVEYRKRLKRLDTAKTSMFLQEQAKCVQI